MMDWTDRHCRYFMRLLSPSALLYTEMVTAAAIVHGDADRFLYFNEEEHPIALQLGGSEPDWMAQATAKAAGIAFGSAAAPPAGMQVRDPDDIFLFRQ